MQDNSLVTMATYLAVYLVVWTFALTAQAASTAWMANYFGDDTAKNQGRISFSPFVQLDLIGSVVIPAVLFMVSWMSMGIPFVAWGKGVPLDHEKLNNSKSAYVAVTLASTLISAILAIGSIIVLKLFFVFGISNEVGFAQTVMHQNFGAEFSWFAPLELMLWYSISINIVLAMLSLTPFYPFSGGVILNTFIKDKFPVVSNFLTKFGLILGLLFIYFVAVGLILNPTLIKVLEFLIAK